MIASHFEIIVEEPSMEAFLREILPRILSDKTTFTIHTFQGKTDLLKKLESRLRGYAKWLPEESRIIVLVDRDDEDCKTLKQSMEQSARQAGLATRTSGGRLWRIANRIAIEELEAWFFGEWQAMRAAYSRLKANTPAKEAYRASDAIAGGTWEALERVLQACGYFTSGLRKVELAMAVAQHFDAARCVSPSFQTFQSVIVEAISPEAEAAAP